MGLVICFDPAFNSNSDIYPKRYKSKDSKERLVILNLKSKSSSSERSNVSSRVRLERGTTAESRKNGTGLCLSSTMSNSYSIYPMTKVHSNLWIGNEYNSNDEDLLTREGITHILSLVGHQSSVEKVVRKQKIMHDLGRSDIKYVLDEVYEFLELGQKDNNNLLVHCTLGENRSAVVVIAFLMKKYRINLYRAHRDLKKVRPIVQVNAVYAKQLLDLELEYFGFNSLPPDWMEGEYNEATNELEFSHENMSADLQKLMFANMNK